MLNQTNQLFAKKEIEGTPWSDSPSLVVSAPGGDSTSFLFASTKVRLVGLETVKGLSVEPILRLKQTYEGITSLVNSIEVVRESERFFVGGENQQVMVYSVAQTTPLFIYDLFDGVIQKILDLESSPPILGIGQDSSSIQFIDKTKLENKSITAFEVTGEKVENIIEIRGVSDLNHQLVIIDSTSKATIVNTTRVPYTQIAREGICAGRWNIKASQITGTAYLIVGCTHGTTRIFNMFNWEKDIFKFFNEMYALEYVPGTRFSVVLGKKKNAYGPDPYTLVVSDLTSYKGCHSSCGSCGLRSTENGCTSCFGGNKLRVDGRCRLECLRTSYFDLDLKRCVACHQLCGSCQGSKITDCLTCPNNSFYKSSDGSCQPCQAPCKTCLESNGSSCLSCLNSSDFLNSKNECVDCSSMDSSELVKYEECHVKHKYTLEYQYDQNGAETEFIYVNITFMPVIPLQSPQDADEMNPGQNLASSFKEDLRNSRVFEFIYLPEQTHRIKIEPVVLSLTPEKCVLAIKKIICKKYLKQACGVFQVKTELKTTNESQNNLLSASHSIVEDNTIDPSQKISNEVKEYFKEQPPLLNINFTTNQAKIA